MRFARTTLIVVMTMVISHGLRGQNILDKINKLEKAVFSIESYRKDGSIEKSASGFFISPDGLAIAPASMFIKLDSLAIKLRNGKAYRIERVLSTHKMANLALFKVFDHRAKGFDYLIPAQHAKVSQAEVLILSDPDETEQGVSLGSITDVFQAPFLDRVVMLSVDFGFKSAGSPVFNNSGELVGIAGYVSNGGINYYLSTHTLNDSLWIDHPYNNWRNSIANNNRNNLMPYMSEGIIHFLKHDWIQAAKIFTQEIMMDTLNVEAYLLRGVSRCGYENYLGMKDDYEVVDRLRPDYFLKYYFEARNLNDKGEKQKAYMSYVKCIQEFEGFSPALIEFGLLSVKLKRDVDTAIKCFNKAIQISPLNAEGYYERSRLLQQFFNKDDLALEDMDKAISLNRLLPGAYSIRGTLKIQSENYLEAINDFDIALAIDPDDTHALFNRGLAYYNLGMKKESCHDWNEAGQRGHYKSIKYISRYCNKIPINKVSRSR